MMTVTPPPAGAAGTLRWSFTGVLMPSASGTVLYTVAINP